MTDKTAPQTEEQQNSAPSEETAAEAPQESGPPSLADVLSDDDFDDRDDTEFLADDEEDGEEEPKEAAAPEPAAEEPTPESTPAPAPEPAPEPESAKVEAAPQPAPQPQAPAQPQPSLADMEAHAIGELSKDFAFSDEDIERFASEPEKVLPRMAAQVMVRSVRASVDAIRAHLPQVIAEHTRQQGVQSAAENKFYETWPQLKGREDAAQAAVQYARAFRQVAPNATAEEVIQNVGASVMVKLGLHNQPAQPSPAATGNGEAQVVRREPLPPHRPAAASPARDLASSNQSDNIFTQLSLEDDF